MTNEEAAKKIIALMKAANTDVEGNYNWGAAHGAFVRDGLDAADLQKGRDYAVAKGWIRLNNMFWMLTAAGNQAG